MTGVTVLLWSGWELKVPTVLVLLFPWGVLCRFRASVELAGLNLRAQNLEFGKPRCLKVTAGMVSVAR